ncbi:hypothetical protein BGZ70_009909 [Mortierella alpina]|uniref:RGS domain-containing protein n=1 Tax=Mortierella alpina TaxID=64518 RepID=A0A9P6M074_MORAP|nr:hypothetical protein BGZ70_009909 [Mortierella alpina]
MPYTLGAFEEFLQSQFCSENLAFWLVVHEYKLCALALQRTVQESKPGFNPFNLHLDSLEHMNAAQSTLFSALQHDMMVILEAFILPGSPYELNLSDTIRCQLLKMVAGGDYRAQVLQPSCESVIDLMKGSAYPLFLERVSSMDASIASFSTTSVANRDRPPWKIKALQQLKLVSKALTKNGF